jgi:hypothetical protein
LERVNEEIIRYLQESCGLPEINVNFDSVWNSNGSDFFHLGSSAFKVNISLKDGHLPVVPCLGTLTAWSSSAANSQVLVWESHWASDFDASVLCITHQTICHLLNSIELTRAECDSGSFDLLILSTLLLEIFIGHQFIILIFYTN